jgi:hypothetical protein
MDPGNSSQDSGPGLEQDTGVGGNLRYGSADAYEMGLMKADTKEDEEEDCDGASKRVS